jgi:uncharacterized protein YcfJ
MKKAMVTGAVLGVALVATGGVWASYSVIDGGLGARHAEVLRVVPVREAVESPREVCREEVVTRQKPVQDEQRVLGTIAGAVIGGVLGNQVGGGSGKKLATVAGAAAGGYAGNKTQERIQSGSTYQTTETRCEPVIDTREVISGYEVSYRYRGEEGTVFMEDYPGNRIPVVDGQLVLNPQAR